MKVLSEVQVSGSPKLPVFLVFVLIFAPKLSKGGRAVWSESAGNVCSKHRTRRREGLRGKEKGNPSNSVAAYRLRDLWKLFLLFLMHHCQVNVSFFFNVKVSGATVRFTFRRNLTFCQHDTQSQSSFPFFFMFTARSQTKNMLFFCMVPIIWDCKVDDDDVHD